ncbi:S1 family peptidase [Flagellimonas sp.]|uniref:S1 family peptidase n=1 Tax=Flagellimonas sp. TaxID=2058762 RepID=UPI003BA9FEF1
MRFNLSPLSFFLFILCVSFQTIKGQEQLISRLESVQSLYIEVYSDTLFLGKATGFVIKPKTQNYLITNWHVVSNKDPQTKKWLNPKLPLSPNKIRILHNSKTLGEYIIKGETLIDQAGLKKFKEFTTGKHTVDVVAIPLIDTIPNVKLYPVDYKKTTATDSILVMPTDRVFVLGFPRGISSAPALPIWKSGLIASEPYIDQEEKPIIWIDIFGYGGMSGSPVYLITDKLAYMNGDKAFLNATTTYFMGVFSHGKFDISTGALWKASFLEKLFDSLE